MNNIDTNTNSNSYTNTNSNTKETIKKTCVWWVCTLVAFLPVAIVIWIIFF